jgi:selenide,water dikinase
MTVDSIKLTQYSHGAGCGCKISPKVLDEILKTTIALPQSNKLLVGNNTRDDAAVYDLGDGTGVISTTDFFMPIVDDAFNFGRIAAANSISDVYAMGGKPLMAIAVLGWPVEKLSSELAQRIVEGGRAICTEADIPLAGGHSIDSPEPIFGLSVTGIIHLKHLKRNNTAKEGDHLFLTKPLGVGILSTAQKRNLLKTDHLHVMIEQMSMLNTIGQELGTMHSVTAMTDVTGFGLLGHLIELAEGSSLSAELYYGNVPLIEGISEYINLRISPDATFRNWNSYSDKVKFIQGQSPGKDAVNMMEAFSILPDPQTNGGLLFTVEENAVEEMKDFLTKAKLGRFATPIGRMIPRNEKAVYVKP